MKPFISILDPGFKYVPSSHTDIAKTFARVRMQLEAEHKRAEEERRKRQVDEARARVFVVQRGGKE